MKILKLENIDEVLINKFNEEKKDFIDTYEKEHKEDLLNMFNKFYSNITHSNKTVVIDLHDYPNLFELNKYNRFFNCKYYKDFCYYCNLKGIEVNLVQCGEGIKKIIYERLILSL